MGLPPSYRGNVEVEWCLKCGQIQGSFPVPTCSFEKDIIAGALYEALEKTKERK